MTPCLQTIYRKFKHVTSSSYVGRCSVRVMVFNATFNNISVISWRSVLFVEESRVPEENRRSTTRHGKTLSHDVVFELTTLVVICTDCIGSYKSTYHTITTIGGCIYFQMMDMADIILLYSGHLMTTPSKLQPITMTYNLTFTCHQCGIPYSFVYLIIKNTKSYLQIDTWITSGEYIHIMDTDLEANIRIDRLPSISVIIVDHNLTLTI